jgi:hypothetical protein
MKQDKKERKMMDEAFVTCTTMMQLKLNAWNFHSRNVQNFILVGLVEGLDR